MIPVSPAVPVNHATDGGLVPVPKLGDVIAAEKVCANVQVFAVLSKGIVAPLVPMAVVAAEVKAVPLVLVHVIAFDPLVVQSPLISELPTAPVLVVTRKIPVPNAPGKRKSAVLVAACMSRTEVALAVIVVVPFVFHPLIPPIAVLLLYCKFPFDPPAVAVAEIAWHPHVPLLNDTACVESPQLETDM